MKGKVKESDLVVLVDTAMKKYFVDTGGKVDKIKGVGVIDPGSLVGKKYGKQIHLGNKQFWILQPSLMDNLQALKRKAQIILPKDAAHIVINCSIKSGDTVLEAGIGSGSLTIVLARTVAPDGKVISYDIKEDFIRHAMKNVKNAQLERYVKPKIKNVNQGIDEHDLDVVILDISNPWESIRYAWEALKIGGYLCSYSPLISQVEKTIAEINNHRFIEVKTIETLQRELIVTSRGTRPSFNMLGHTGYLTFARKVL
jgi:tRNA (adenine57-N1/adenine58-N1)-methyltransferase